MWLSIVCCVELQDNFIHSKMHFWITLILITTINGDIVSVPYPLWHFRAEYTPLELIEFTATVLLAAILPVYLSTGISKPLAYYYYSKMHFWTILEHTIYSSLDLRLSLQASLDFVSLHQDFHVQCPVFWQTKASLTNKQTRSTMSEVAFIRSLWISWAATGLSCEQKNKN